MIFPCLPLPVVTLAEPAPERFTLYLFGGWVLAACVFRLVAAVGVAARVVSRRARARVSLGVGAGSRSRGEEG